MNEAPALLPGRDAEIELLCEHLARAVAGDQQLVLLEGEAGTGKSTLLKAFASMQARRGLRGPRVFYLRAPEGEPYQPVHHAALAATSSRLYAQLGIERQATEHARDLLPDWLAAIPGIGALLAAVYTTADALHRRRKRRIFEEIDTNDENIAALLDAARRRPLLLLLDDLERADRHAVALLEALICTADEGARILIVGAYRPTAPGVTDPPIHLLRRTLPLRGEFFHHHRLGSLDRESIREHLRGRFRGAVVPEELVDWLVESTGGHPATLATALTHLQLRGAIRRGIDRWHFVLDASRPALSEIEPFFADLSALPLGVSDSLLAASALGVEFDAATLAERMRRDELAVEDQLAMAVHAGVLQNRGEYVRTDGELTTSFRFASSHLHAAIRRQVSWTDPPTREEGSEAPLRGGSESLRPSISRSPEES